MIGIRLGPWIIDGELGRGGMGTVYRAHADPPTSEGPAEAALKVLAAELALDPGFRQRFQREIDILRQLDHPNVVQFLGSGEEQGRFYFAMEFVDGPNFEALQTQSGKIPWPEVLDLALQVTLALRHAHDRGVIHRDIKPSNLLRAARTVGEDYPFGLVKLTDFGIASLFASPHLTVAGGVVGTAEYLSPEQAAGKPVTKRSDLYSLGVVLYTLLTGRTPFRGDIPTLLHQHRFGQFDRPARLVPEVPPDFDAEICQLLEKDPARRPGDAGALHRQLSSIQRKMERKAANAVLNSGVHGLPDVKQEGTATLMSRLMRAELERQNKGGPVKQFFNRPLVIVMLFLLTLGSIVWAFWPPSAESLYRRGSQLMESADRDDWVKGWDDYLEPMTKRYPDHAHQKELTEYKARHDAYLAERASARAARFAGPMTEAQWLYQDGLRRRQLGDEVGARRTWQLMTIAFGEVPTERPWVQRAQDELKRPLGEVQPNRRVDAVERAIESAAALRAAGKDAEAAEVVKALRQLYEGDKTVERLLPEK